MLRLSLFHAVKTLEIQITLEVVWLVNGIKCISTNKTVKLIYNQAGYST